MNKIFLFLLFFGASTFANAQSKIAITIDDVPSTRKFERRNFQTPFLNQLDSLGIPATIFINEGTLYNTDYVSKNFDLLNRWIESEYITPGNHTFSHLRYSAVGYKKFVADIEKGEAITRELAKKHGKSLKYFRFPYNDLGADSLQQVQIQTYLNEKGYVSTPFTVESSDWVFNALYEHYLKKNDLLKAKEIANEYINTTLACFSYFDSLAIARYNRPIHQIYLCHDNSLNADYFSILVEKLKERGHTFITLDEAMQDKVYQQKNNYSKKWGISWFYRWMNDETEMKKLMRAEPDISDIYERYQKIQNR